MADQSKSCSDCSSIEIGKFEMQHVAYFLSQTLRVHIIALCFFVLALSGCQSLVYKPTGQVLAAYGQDQATSYVLKMADPMSGCALGESFSPFLLSFAQVDVDVHRNAILLYNLSGFCAQTRAWQAELRQLRALHAKNATEAKDALTQKNRFEALAAQRRYQGYQALVTVFGEPSRQCPDLSTTQDEFFYLIGLLNGLQASQNNIASHQASGLPLNITNQVGRGAACLSSEKWWGVVDALQAAVLLSMPNETPDDINPQQILRKSSQVGVQQGVRLSHVIEAEVNIAASDTQALKQLISEYASLIDEQPADPELMMIDQIAFAYMQFFSDRIWTQERGHRTPHGQFGRFWQPRKAQPTPALDIDDLI